MDKVTEMPTRPLSMLESIAELHTRNHRYDQAINFYSMALEKSNSSEKTDPSNRERLFLCLAQSYVNNKSYNEALVYYLKALSSKSARFDYDNTEIVQVTDKILSFCDTLQSCQKCIESLEKSLIMSQSNSKDHTYPKIISKLYETIATIYYLQKDFSNAVKYFEKTLQVIQENSELVQTEFDLLINCSIQLASIHLEQKSHHHVAISFFKKALDILLKTPKEENYQKIEKLSQDIGFIYLQKEEYNNAIQYYRICLETKMKRVGLCHPELVSTLNILAEIYLKQGNHNDALVSYNQSYRMIMKTSANNPQLIQVYCKMGFIYKAKKNWDQTLKYFSKALKATKSISPDENKDKERLMQIYKEIGEAFYNQGQYEESIKFLKKVLKTEKELLGESCSNNLDVYLKIVNLYELLGEYKKAKEYLLQLFLLQKKLFGDYNLCTQATLGRLETLGNRIKDMNL